MSSAFVDKPEAILAEFVHLLALARRQNPGERTEILQAAWHFAFVARARYPLLCHALCTLLRQTPETVRFPLEDVRLIQELNAVVLKIGGNGK